VNAFTTADAIRAHARGVALEDPRTRALEAELHGVLELANKTASRLDAVQQERAALRTSRDHWRQRWVWTFGALMLAIALDVLGFIAWRISR
jgi:hypothetical protein